MFEAFSFSFLLTSMFVLLTVDAASREQRALWKAFEAVSRVTAQPPKISRLKADNSPPHPEVGSGGPLTLMSVTTVENIKTASQRWVLISGE